MTWILLNIGVYFYGMNLFLEIKLLKFLVFKTRSKLKCNKMEFLSETTNFWTKIFQR